MSESPPEVVPTTTVPEAEQPLRRSEIAVRVRSILNLVKSLNYHIYYHLLSTVKRERFFAHVYFSNKTVSQKTVWTGKMKMFLFVHVVCRFDKIKTNFRVCTEH